MHPSTPRRPPPLFIKPLAIQPNTRPLASSRAHRPRRRRRLPKKPNTGAHGAAAIQAIKRTARAIRRPPAIPQDRAPLGEQRALEWRVRAPASSSRSRDDRAAAPRQRRVCVAAPAAHGAGNGGRARVARRRAKLGVRSRRGREEGQAEQLPLGGRQGNVGEVVLGAEEREAGEADLDDGDDLEYRPGPGEV